MSSSSPGLAWPCQLFLLRFMRMSLLLLMLSVVDGQSPNSTVQLKVGLMDSLLHCSKQSYQCAGQCIPKLLHCEGSCTEGYISCGSLCLEEEFHWKCGEICLYHEEPCENSCPLNYILCGTECVDIKSVERDIEWFENSCKYGATNTQWLVHSLLFILLLSLIKKYL